MSRKPNPTKCPICGDTAALFSAPFCSTRCKDVDLNRWLSGNYTIPLSPHAPDEPFEE